jgi:hypothetical protein
MQQRTAKSSAFFFIHQRLACNSSARNLFGEMLNLHSFPSNALRLKLRR